MGSRPFSVFLAAFVTLLGFVGCAGSPTLRSVSISPTVKTLNAVGQTVQFQVIGTFQREPHPPHTQDITTECAWQSSNTAVATVDATGLTTATGAGSANITATYQTTGIIATARLDVALPAPPAPARDHDIVSVSVIPGSQTALSANQTAQFIAIGTTAAGTTVNLTNQSATVGGVTIDAAVWSSASPSVATIDPASGVSTALTTGRTTITALVTNPDGTVATGTATLAVTLPVNGGGSGTSEPLISLSVVPGNLTLTSANQVANFVVIGTTSSSTTVNLTNVSATIGNSSVKAASWTSSVPSVASVDPKTGVVTALSNGVTAVTAMAANPDGTDVSSTALVTVNLSAAPEPLASMTIIPGAQSAFAVNQNVQFIAIGTSSDGKTKDLTNQATWKVSNTGVANINPGTGLAIALSAGSTAISALATNPDGSVVTASAVLTVVVPPSPEPLVSVAIIPRSQRAYAVKQTSQFIAIGTTGQGSTVDLTRQATWASSNVSVASIDPQTGLATAQSPGSTAITAIVTNPDGTAVTGTAAFEVTAGAPSNSIVSLNLIPSTQTVMAVGQKALYYAIGTTGAGTAVDLTNQAAWSATDVAVASVNSSGLATASARGSTAIVAIYKNSDGTVVTGTGSLTVNNPIWTSLTVLPGTIGAVAAGERAQFLAIGQTGTGASVDLTRQAKWQSSDTSIATVDANGVATAVNTGNATITAIFTNADGTIVHASGAYDVNVTGTQEPLLSLQLLPATGTAYSADETTQFLAMGTFSSPSAPNISGCSPASGLTRDCTLAVTWSSSDVKVATINSSGLATAVNQGTTAIFAQEANPDGTLIMGAGSFTSSTNTTGTQYATLTITLVGANANNGLVTLNPTTAPGATVNCSTNSPQYCVYTLPLNTTLVLTPTGAGGATFSGWSVPCTKYGLNQCTITLDNNQTVAAIFN